MREQMRKKLGEELKLRAKALSSARGATVKIENSVINFEVMSIKVDLTSPPQFEYVNSVDFGTKKRWRSFSCNDFDCKQPVSQ